MRGIQFDGTGGLEVIRLVEVPKPEPRPRDVLVRVHAAGVNRADVLQRRGVYGKAPDYGDSLLPGLEIAGEVVQSGAEAKLFPPGARVMAIVGGGAYAEFARVDERMCMPIPARLNYEQAAAIPEVFVTAHEALIHLGRLTTGNWALIHAATGGVGSAAVLLAHAAGAQTVFTGSGKSRLEAIARLGGTVGVDYYHEDFLDAVMRATGDRGVDVVIDFIGGPYLDRNLRALAPGGRLVQVGIMGTSERKGGEGKLPLDLLLYHYLHIIGTVMKSRSFREKLAMTNRFRDRWLAAFDSGQLSPLLDRTFPLEQAAEAHRAMEGPGKLGKIVLTMDSPRSS